MSCQQMNLVSVVSCCDMSMRFDNDLSDNIVKIQHDGGTAEFFIPWSATPDSKV